MPVGIGNSNTVGGKKIIKKISKPAAKPKAKPMAKPAAKPVAKPVEKPVAKPVAKPKKGGGILSKIFNSGVNIGELNKDYKLGVMYSMGIVSVKIKSFLRKILVTNEEIKKNKEKLKEELTNFYDKKVLNAQILYLLSNKLERLIDSIFEIGDIEYNKELQNIKKELDDDILSATNKDLDLDISPNKNKLYNYHFKTNIKYFINVLGVDKIIAELNIGEKVAEHIKKSNDDDDDYMTRLFYLFKYYIGKENFKDNTIYKIIIKMNNNILEEIEEIYKKPFMSDYNNYINKLEAKKMYVSDEDVSNEIDFSDLDEPTTNKSTTVDKVVEAEVTEPSWKEYNSLAASNLITEEEFNELTKDEQIELIKQAKEC
jgi:hypothetical protein